MSQEIFAIAVVRPHPGHDEEVIAILHELYGVMTAKNYSRNLLYHDAKDNTRLVNLRYWSSQEARSRAQEDPDVHRCWERLGQAAIVEQVFEQLDEIPVETRSPAR